MNTLQMNNPTRLLLNALTVVVGNFIYAIGVVFFILPSGLITGGTTGIALTMNHFFGISVSGFVGIFNIVMFLIGFALLGKEFAMNTLISTFMYPILLGFLQRTTNGFMLTSDPLLSALFGGLCIGIALAMILRIGASTGGMDIPPLVLQKYFRIPLSISLYVFDFLILIFQMIYSEREISLYGIVLVIVYTITLDKLLSYGSAKSEIRIVSPHYEEIRKAILSDVDRGVTLYHGQTGYMGTETEVLSCVIDPREVYRIDRIVRNVDPNAFMTLCKVTRVTGRGFTEAKKYMDAPEE